MATNRSRGGVAVKVEPKSVAAAVVALALAIGTYFAFTAPQHAKATSLDAQVSAAKSTLARNRQRNDDLLSGKKSTASELLTQAGELDTALPSEVNKVDLVGSIPDMASRYGVVLNQIDPSSVADPAAGSLRTQAFTVSASGPTDGLASWVEALQTYPSTLTVSGMTLNASGGAQSTATFTLRAYYVPTPTVVKH